MSVLPASSLGSIHSFLGESEWSPAAGLWHNYWMPPTEPPSLQPYRGGWITASPRGQPASHGHSNGRLQLNMLSGEKKWKGEMRGGMAGEALAEQLHKLPLEPGGSCSWLVSWEDGSFVDSTGRSSTEKAKLADYPPLLPHNCPFDKLPLQQQTVRGAH